MLRIDSHSTKKSCMMETFIRLQKRFFNLFKSLGNNSIIVLLADISKFKFFFVV